MTSLPHPIPLPEFLWTREAATYLTACMERRCISYERLAAELAFRGTDITAPRLQARISGGDLSAGLFFQIMHVLGVEQVEIANVDPYDGDDTLTETTPRTIQLRSLDS